MEENLDETEHLTTKCIKVMSLSLTMLLHSRRHLRNVYISVAAAVSHNCLLNQI